MEIVVVAFRLKADTPTPPPPDEGEGPRRGLDAIVPMSRFAPPPFSGGLFTFDAFGIFLGWFVALEMKDEVS